jgi:hypothetical protein
VKRDEGKCWKKMIPSIAVSMILSIVSLSMLANDVVQAGIPEHLSPYTASATDSRFVVTCSAFRET